jgi:hypothetical protein
MDRCPERRSLSITTRVNPLVFVVDLVNVR